MKKTVTMVSGGFDPLHVGHVKLINGAWCIAGADSIIVVGVNSDEWLMRKKGYVFMPQRDRMAIMESLYYVNYALSFDDSDNSAIDLIRECQKILGEKYNYVFANGGDRTKDNIPEMNADYEYPVEFRFGVGGKHKMESSSELIRKVRENQ
jgi:cytidyltransferase-like protein